MSDRLHREWESLRCLFGFHRLRGYRDCGDGVNVQPINPYWRPGRGDWRVCTWCGARAA